VREIGSRPKPGSRESWRSTGRRAAGRRSAVKDSQTMASLDEHGAEERGTLSACCSMSYTAK